MGQKSRSSKSKPAKANVKKAKTPALKKTSPAVKTKAVHAPAPKPVKAPEKKLTPPVAHPHEPPTVNKHPSKPHPPTEKMSLSKDFIERQRLHLLELRDHILDQMQGVAQDNLRSRPEGSEASAFGEHQADAGSDAYEKDFALSLLSQEQDALYEIEEALKRIEGGIYGVCEMSGKPIPAARLEAVPFARCTVECQQQLERENRGRRRWDTAPQFMDTADNFSEDEDEGIDDEDRKKDKD
jgi:DnaK suppressor protein